MHDLEEIMQNMNRELDAQGIKCRVEAEEKLETLIYGKYDK